MHSLPIQNIPSELTVAHRWVMHSHKVPRTPNGANASSTDARSWSSFDDVIRTLRTGDFDGIGIVLGGGIVGVDIDHCINPATGTLNAIAQACLARCPPGTFIEISPSGTGLHIIGHAPEASRGLITFLIDGKVEFYPGKRYFTVTGNLWIQGAQPSARLQDISALVDWLREQAQATSVAPLPVEFKEPAPDLREVRRMLFHIAPSDDSVWLQVGMALKEEYGGQGWPIFDEWSARTTRNNYEPVENWQRWESFGRSSDGAKVGVGTLKYLARKGGYTLADAVEFEPVPEKAAPAGQDGPGQARTGLLISATTVKSEPIAWLWKGFLAPGKIHIVAGRPGTLKTTLALQWLAVISTGGSWPDGSRCPIVGNVVIWSGEDSIVDTLSPRLEAAGADLSRVWYVTPEAAVETLTGDVRTFDPATDMAVLKEQASQIPGGVQAVLIDSVVSAVSGDSHKNAEVRRGLQPLKEIAEELGCVVLGISHFTKGTEGKDPVDRVTGSLAFGAMARIVYAAVRDSEHEGVYQLVRSKSNIGPDGGGFDYSYEVVTLHDNIETTRVVWGQAIEGEAREIINAAEGNDVDHDKGGQLQAAKDLLRDLLKSGVVSVKDKDDAIRAHGISQRTMDRAKKELGVKAIKEGHDRWVWIDVL